MAKVNTGEVQYDQRLFNQEQGLGSGFAADDAYGVYDKALFADRRCERALGIMCFRWSANKVKGDVLF